MQNCRKKLRLHLYVTVCLNVSKHEEYKDEKDQKQHKQSTLNKNLIFNSNVFLISPQKSF